MDKHHIFDATFKCFNDIFSAAKAAREKGYEFILYEDCIYFLDTFGNIHQTMLTSKSVLNVISYIF